MSDLRLGDCLDVLRELDDASVDAVVTDPPYGISFMGNHWDRFAIDERVGRRDVSQLGVRLTGGTDSPNRKETSRTASAFANAAGAAGAYDLTLTGSRAFQQWVEAWAIESLRVLKPGGHLLSFGGTRTYHRLAAGIEDAGFEIRDCLAWLFGSGFPKSLDVSKAIDARAGAAREIVGRYVVPADSDAGNAGQVIRSSAETGHFAGGYDGEISAVPDGRPLTAPATPEAERWQGWGTALKPAHEPIVLARKPLAGTVAANVLEHGTGALNVGGCAIEFRDQGDEAESKGKNRHADFGSGAREKRIYGSDERTRAEQGNYDAPGRWPANVLLDEAAAAMLDEQTGELAAGASPPKRGIGSSRVYGDALRAGVEKDREQLDASGASRFFYCAKVSSAERNAGCEHLDTHIAKLPGKSTGYNPATGQTSDGYTGERQNHHPTVKPIDLMRWLIRLVTPPGGLVLDPFLGSGTTGCAAALEHVRFLGVEREPDYMRIAQARIAFWAEHGADGLEIVRRRDAADRAREQRTEAGQLDLLAQEPAS